MIFMLKRWAYLVWNLPFISSLVNIILRNWDRDKLERIMSLRKNTQFYLWDYFKWNRWLTWTYYANEWQSTRFRDQFHQWKTKEQQKSKSETKFSRCRIRIFIETSSIWSELTADGGGILTKQVRDGSYPYSLGWIPRRQFFSRGDVLVLE